MRNGRVHTTMYIYALALLLAPVLVFWPLWWPFDSQQYGFALGDFSEQHVAMRTFVVSQLQRGRLPFWDPYTFAGEPAIADSLFSTFYLPSLWQIVFPPAWMYWVLQVEALWHAGIAGVFTLFLVRRLTGSTRAGFLAGLAFAISGYLTSYPMLQIIILQAATWLPAALWAVDKGLEARSCRFIVLAGVFLAWSILAGHFQTFMYVAYTVAAFVVWKVWRLRRPWHTVLTTGALLAVVSLGLSAAQWLPTLQMLPYSPHANVGYDYISNGFQLWELWGLLRPNPEAWSPLYVGLPALILALWAVVGGARRETWFWAGLALVALNLSLGRYGVLFPLVYRWWPGLSLFREQERWALVVVFSLAVLAGYGYAALVRRWPRAARAFWPLALLLFIDLWRANSGVILEPVPPTGPFVASPAVKHVAAVSPPHWRMSSEGLLPGGANAGLVFRIRDVVGSGPLYQEALDEFVNTVPEIRWWQMLNVRHVLTRRELQHGGLLHVLDEDGKHLYQTFIGARTAWIAHAYEVAPSRAAAIQATARPDLDPFTTVVLEEEPAPRPVAPSSTPAGEDIRLLTFADERIVVEATLATPGILVMSEVWYPGWNVYVNGERARSLRAYGLLRAVALPAGTWQVEWRFQPVVMWAGIGLSLITALMLLLVWVVTRRTPHTTRNPSRSRASLW